MNPTFERLYRQVGHDTLGVLLATLTVYALMLVFALLVHFSGVIDEMKSKHPALFDLSRNLSDSESEIFLTPNAGGILNGIFKFQKPKAYREGILYA